MSLEAYATEFFGFGRWDAPVWFVGIEEAGNPSPEQLQHRVSIWTQRHQPTLADAPEFYPATGHNEWHGDKAVLQKTWKQLIRMLLLAQGKLDTLDGLLSYQRTQLGAA